MFMKNAVVSNMTDKSSFAVVAGIIDGDVCRDLNTYNTNIEQYMQCVRQKRSRIVKTAEKAPFRGQIFSCQFWEQITAL